jgi:ribosomal protein S18 acetylase RimI-like enzyme
VTDAPSTLVRAATPEDAPGIAAVAVASWRTTYRGLIADETIDGRTVETQAPRWRETLSRDGCVAVVAEAEDGGGRTIVGFAQGGRNRATRPPFDAWDGELNAIYLLKAHQGGGAGRRLVRAFSAALLEHGFTSMIVWVLDRNLAARAFYERLGGRYVGAAEITIEGVAYPDVAYAWDRLDALLQRLDGAPP